MSEDFQRGDGSLSSANSGVDASSPPSASPEPAPRASGYERHAPDVVKEDFVVVNERGMHLRAAAKLALLASRFECHLVLERDGVTATARSVMELLLLRAARGTTIAVTVSGKDARACVTAIGDLISRGFEDVG